MSRETGARLTAPLPRRGIVPAAALALLLAVPASSSAVELDDVFAEERGTPPPRPAEAIVEDAFENLFGFDGVMLVESVATRPDSEPVRTSFWVYRKRTEPDTTRTMVATIDADGQGMRLLEIEREGSLRGWIFAPRVDPQPMTTPYRLTDPFLGTFSDLDAREVRADLNELARSHEIVSREATRLGDADVWRIGLRPIASRRFERVEVFILRDQPFIVEYRFFEGGRAEPARVARAPRDQMQTFEGRPLPGRMVYSDRLEESETELVISYRGLPAENGDRVFAESSFHRAELLAR